MKSSTIIYCIHFGKGKFTNKINRFEKEKFRPKMESERTCCFGKKITGPRAGCVGTIFGVALLTFISYMILVDENIILTILAFGKN